MCIPDASKWDGDPYLLGVANGVIDLRAGVCRPGRPTIGYARWLLWNGAV